MDFFDSLLEEEKAEDKTVDLGLLTELCNMMAEKEKEVKEAEKKLANLVEQYRIISQDSIPDLMEKLRVEEIKLENGRKIFVKEDMKVSIKKETREEFLTWMIKKGYQPLIKNKVEVQFPKDGRQSAQRFIKYLKRYYADRDKCNFNEKEDIHPMTLKSWVKSMKEQGASFPEEYLNLYEYKIARLK